LHNLRAVNCAEWKGRISWFAIGLALTFLFQCSIQCLAPKSMLHTH